MIIDTSGEDLFPLRETFRETLTVVKKHWWSEKDFVFLGIPATAYEWPRDRLICFYRESSFFVVKSRKSGMDAIYEGKSLIVPTFHLDTIEGSIFDELRRAIKASEENFKNGMHLHVVKVNTTKEYAIFIGDKKLSPIVDYWFDSESRKDKMLARREK